VSDDSEGASAERRLLLSIERTERAPAAARRALQELISDAPAAARHAPTLTLLISEVVTNAVVHPKSARGSEIELRIVVNEQLTRVVVTDEGSGFVPVASAPRERGAGGYGLTLLDSAASRWGTSDGGGRFSVWFEIDHAAAERGFVN
jgi:anti-sigma regulatory factor (Ser/Thr protein kinase)